MLLNILQCIGQSLPQSSSLNVTAGITERLGPGSLYFILGSVPTIPSYLSLSTSPVSIRNSFTHATPINNAQLPSSPQFPTAWLIAACTTRLTTATLPLSLLVYLHRHQASHGTPSLLSRPLRSGNHIFVLWCPLLRAPGTSSHVHSHPCSLITNFPCPF